MKHVDDGTPSRPAVTSSDGPASRTGELLLEIEHLETRFMLDETVYAVNDVSFSIQQGSVLGIVGESGSGKSVTALSIMRLIEAPGKIAGGRVLFHGAGGTRDVLRLSMSELEHIRGNQISMVFQDPMTSLNPALAIGYQIMEPLRVHRRIGSAEAKAQATELLRRVGIPQPERRLNDFPHQFSGGMRQRVMLAMAVACTPKLLIADEPTTALDVTIQAQILDLISELKEELGTAVIIISHDLGVIAQLADYVAVMYGGMIVEYGPIEALFESPQHPYTRALIASIPQLRSQPDRLRAIGGAPPSLTRPLEACPFEPRCRYRVERCAVERPPLLELAPAHSSACWVAQAGGLDDG